MQLTSEQYEVLATELGCYVDAGLLFDPATSVNIGTYWISRLYDKYKSFTTVYAAMYIGEETVDAWLSDESLVDKNGKLLKIPDRDTEKYVERVSEAIKVYRELDK
jgi:soluble lytic murein transglycosylase